MADSMQLGGGGGTYEHYFFNLMAKKAKKNLRGGHPLRQNMGLKVNSH